jgi:uncharacterized tellurite resistance protein B-like protein
MYEEIEKIIEILKIILGVESIEIKNCALESLIERLEDFKKESIEK